jgi:hypothetical protein
MKVVASPSPNAAKLDNHFQYHPQLDQLKQKIVESEKKVDECNKGISYQYFSKLGFILFNSSKSSTKTCGW